VVEIITMAISTNLQHDFSVALARPGIILPIERAITRMKKKVLKRVIS
jgi:hypothetical protein